MKRAPIVYWWKSCAPPCAYLWNLIFLVFRSGASQVAMQIYAMYQAGGMAGDMMGQLAGKTNV
jgi:hypothetical protein